MKQEQEQEFDITKPTKKYDAIATNVRKLLSASAQTFIPQLCDALREDWCPELSDEKIKSNLRLQKVIRNKIFNEWSKEGGYSEDNIWKDITIQMCLPDWLRNPIKQTESQQEQLSRMRQAKLEKRISLNPQQKNALEKFVTNLPKTVIIPKPKEPEEEQITEEFEEQMHGIGLGKYGESGKTYFGILQEIHEGANRCFKNLCDGKPMPSIDEDLLVDYIRPTREYRLGLAMEIDKSERVNLHNLMHNLIEAAEDMITQIAKADGEE